MFKTLKRSTALLPLGLTIAGCGGPTSPAQNSQADEATVHRYTQIVECAAIHRELQIGYQEMATSNERREDSQRQASLHEQAGKSFESLAERLIAETNRGPEGPLRSTMIQRRPIVDILEASQRIQQETHYGRARVDALTGRVSACDALMPSPRN